MTLKFGDFISDQHSWYNLYVALGHLFENVELIVVGYGENAPRNMICGGCDWKQMSQRRSQEDVEL